jgi:hypothetical protein
MDQRIGEPEVYGSLAELDPVLDLTLDRGHEQSAKGEVARVVAAVFDQAEELYGCLFTPAPRVIRNRVSEHGVSLRQVHKMHHPMRRHFNQQPRTPNRAFHR